MATLDKEVNLYSREAIKPPTVTEKSGAQDEGKFKDINNLQALKKILNAFQKSNQDQDRLIRNTISQVAKQSKPEDVVTAFSRLELNQEQKDSFKENAGAFAQQNE